MKSESVIILLCFVVISTSCGFLSGEISEEPISADDNIRYPPTGFSEETLVGVWQEMWKEGHYKERLVLHADGTYEYTYEVPKTNYRYDIQEKWWIKEAEIGCLYIHLEGMRYYHSTRSIAENGNRKADGTPEKFLDPCVERIVIMPDFVLLVIGKDPGEKGKVAIYFGDEIYGELLYYTDYKQTVRWAYINSLVMGQ